MNDNERQAAVREALTDVKLTEDSGPTSGIMQAIQNVQQQAGFIQKNSNGQVGQGKFKYANLADTWLSVKQLLKDNDIVVYQTPTSTNGGTQAQYFKTTLHHLPTGEEVSETMGMVLTRNDPQALGAAITFYRRYMLTSMLGLIPDDDNDAREHRLATLEQKKKIVGAVRLSFPEITAPEQINQTLENILGKHPSQIREDEADKAIELIQSYTKE
jgi:hypothetical protein